MATDVAELVRCRIWHWCTCFLRHHQSESGKRSVSQYALDQQLGRPSQPLSHLHRSRERYDQHFRLLFWLGSQDDPICSHWCRKLHGYLQYWLASHLWRSRWLLESMGPSAARPAWHFRQRSWAPLHNLRSSQEEVWRGYPGPSDPSYSAICRHGWYRLNNSSLWALCLRERRGWEWRQISGASL